MAAGLADILQQFFHLSSSRKSLWATWLLSRLAFDGGKSEERERGGTFVLADLCVLRGSCSALDNGLTMTHSHSSGGPAAAIQGLAGSIGGNLGFGVSYPRRWDLSRRSFAERIAHRRIDNIAAASVRRSPWFERSLVVPHFELQDCRANER